MKKYIVEYKDGSKREFNFFENFLISHLTKNLDKKKYGREFVLAKKLGKIYTKEFDFWLGVPQNNEASLLSLFTETKKKELNYLYSIYLSSKEEKRVEKNLEDICLVKKLYKLEEEKVGEDVKITKKIRTLKDFIYGQTS